MEGLVKIKFWLLIVLFLYPVYAQKINIAILQFDAANITEAEVRILTDRLSAELINIGTYNVVERSVMEEVLKEQGFQQSGCVSNECVIEVGKLVGVEQIIAGTMGKIGSIYTVSARMIDVRTGSVLAQKSLDCMCPIETLLTESMAEIAVSLSSGTVVKKPPAPSFGSVSFTSFLDSVEILFEDESQGFTPLTLTYLSPGSYEYSARKQDYRTTTGQIEVKADIETEIQLSLIGKRGRLVIQPGHTGQKLVVLIDETGHRYSFDFANDTLSNFIDLLEGQYNISITENGYHDFNKSIIIEDQLTVTLVANNEQILVPVTFKFTNQPDIFKIDYSDVSINSNQSTEYPFGEYPILAKKPKYQTFKSSFTVDKNEPLNIDIQLIPKSKSKSKLYSTLFPGFGQIYAEHYPRGVVYTALTIGAGLVINSTYQNYQDEKALMDQYYEDYQGASGLAVAPLSLQYQNQVDVVNDVQIQLAASAVILGTTWFVNVVDAYLFNGLPSE